MRSVQLRKKIDSDGFDRPKSDISLYCTVYTVMMHA